MAENEPLIDLNPEGRSRWNPRKYLNLNSQRTWRAAMVVLTIIALIVAILFSVDAGFKFSSTKQVVPGVNKWTSTVLAGLGIILIPVFAYIYKKKGTIGDGLVVK